MGRRAGTPWARALGVVALIGIAASALASGAEAQGTWSEVAPMPTARTDLAAGVVDGKLYALGGVDDDGNLLSTVEAYNPPKPDSGAAPVAAGAAVAVVIGAAAGGVALLASVAAAIVIKRRRALYRQQAARLTMARGSASPSLASV